MPDDILTSIDSALAGWEADSMRWTPHRVPRLTGSQMAVARRLSADTGVDGYAAAVMVADVDAMADHAGIYIGDGSGWTHIGHTTGPFVHFDRAPDLPEVLRMPGPLTITVDGTGYLAGLYRAIHDMDRYMHPERHRRCDTCHPEMAPRPLAVNGREYHRRRKARLRRKNR